MDYSSAKFNGSYVDGRFEDLAGTYVYQDGTQFIGSLKNGAFHGPGRLLFKGGEYKGLFEKGKAVSGEYMFYDDLKYDEKEWSYCNGSGDRRFQSERASDKINPAGTLPYNDKKGRVQLQEGCFDAGDGFLNEKDNVIYSYDDNSRIRDADKKERDFVLSRGAASKNYVVKGKKPDEDEA